MTSYARIVVGSDGSEAARDAIAVAGAVAARLAVPVTAATVWKQSIEVPGARDETWAQRTTTGADVDLYAQGVRDVVRIAVEGDPSDALIEIASQVPDTLIVVGAHGLGSATSRMTGSASNQLSHSSPVDVLFVRNRVPKVESVALATDGSETALLAVRRGFEFASALGARVSLITVADSLSAGEQILENVEQQLVTEYPDAVVERRPTTGDVADVLASDAGRYDVLVIGNRGMSGFARVLGSTANTVTHKASSNLLLVNTTRTPPVAESSN
ncbi:universal stress protein [Antrihabitans stalactiti]|uniref:Universal stress protein n=1 Tax=Antrihabitans stalactiti TaxID=2584121 RepID=A0A848K589_9NOCA|nr:universal stress protein [Antrihabitans stalactiti]NMN93761.1 universal stress protein [Antrihabitans stalactiti]